MSVNSARAILPTAPPPTFVEIYEAHFDYVWRTLRRLGVREAEVEDATQEVFVVVYRKLEDYDPSRPLKPWLAGIAHKVAVAERRRARHRREELTESPADGPCSGLTPEAHLRLVQRRNRAFVALDTLDMDRRVVFVMYEMEHIPCTEIADAIGVPLNTVYSRLRVARERFKAAIMELRKREGEV